MEFLSGISSFVKEATDQLDGLIQSIHDEDDDFQQINSTSLTSVSETNATDDDEGADLYQGDTATEERIRQFVVRLTQDLQIGKELFVQESFKLKDQSPDEYQMSERQIEHARAVIQLVPAFDKLRFQLCPSTLSDKTFWRIYFHLIQTNHELPAQENLKVSNNVKREREEAEDFTSRVMPSMLLDGAKKTLKFAEQLIESVDEQASIAIRPTMSPKAEMPESCSNDPTASHPFWSKPCANSVDGQSTSKLPIRRIIQDGENPRKEQVCLEEEVEGDWSVVDVQREDVSLTDEPFSIGEASSARNAEMPSPEQDFLFV